MANRDQPDKSPQAAWILVGPTAAGKSAVAQSIAENTHAEILSTDSMQVYCDMDIGTAKPPEEYRERVKYWGLDVAAPDEDFTSADFIAHAKECIGSQKPETGSLIVVGGTGLYVKLLTQGLDSGSGTDPELRSELNALLASGGITALQQRLRDHNPGGYAALKDPNNPRRLIRAIERGKSDDTVSTSWSDRPVAKVVGLTMDRDLLHKRIATRVHEMYAQGFRDEVERLLARYKHLSRTAAQAIGYREIIGWISGDCSREEAIERTIIRTRQFAKRQMTWYRNQFEVHWVEVNDQMTVSEIGREVEKRWKQHGPNRLTA